MNLQRRTARLQLIAANLTHLEAELEAPGALAALLDARVPASWPPGQYDRDAMLFFRTQLIEGGPAVVGWYGWYAVREAIAGARELVGNGGFFGPPDAAGRRRSATRWRPSSPVKASRPSWWAGC